MSNIDAVDSDDQALHAHRYGPDRPAQILAIHGLTGYGGRWQTLAERYLPDTAVVAPDLIGHGRSSWAAPWTLDANTEALATLIDAPVLVVGHSFGCAVGLNLAAARPDLVAGLVLLDPAVGLDGGWMRDIADRMFASPDYTDRDEARNEKASASWGDVEPAELDRELDEHLIGLPNGRCGWRVSIPAMMSYWSELARPIMLPHKGTSTTVVRAAGTDPPYTSTALIAALTERLGGDFTLLEWDCRHMVPLALPKQTAALIAAALRG